MKIIILLLCSSLLIVGIYILLNKNTENLLSPISTTIKKPKPLEKYSFNNLRTQQFMGTEIIIDKILRDHPTFTSYLFFMKVNNKKVSGLINIPKSKGIYPLIIMVRGYVDREQYTPGMGTQHGGETFAQNNFVTIAPDFLGYGFSDKPPVDVMEDRFLTYVTILELLSSAKQINIALEAKKISGITIEEDKIGLWGHSNGGQIALSVLEISGKKIPTVLWAPVSKPFPYSILYYTDDFDDHGKALRKVVSHFENDYDSEQYSLTNYYHWIKGDIQIHQGTADEAVPLIWSDQLAKTLRDKKISVEYFTYLGDDHNFAKGNWLTVIERNIRFFREKFNNITF